MASGWGRLRRALGGSALANARDWTSDSRLVAGLRETGDHVARAVRASWLYGWFTAEPEPEMIVIDLRETRLVGPVIELLDFVVDRVTPYWRDSRLHDAVLALKQVGRRISDTRAGRLLVRVLTPPEPVADEDRADGERSG